MFDQVKVNQNSVLNLVKIPEKNNFDILSEKPENNFFAMVMEKKGFEENKNRADQFADTRDNRVKNEQSGIDRKNDTSERELVKSRDDREVSTTGNEKNDTSVPAKKEAKADVENKPESKEPVDKSENPVKDVKVKKNSDDDEDEAGVIDQLDSEENIKNLLEIIEAALKGNKQGEEESLQKLFKNLKLKADKESTTSASSSEKKDPHKSVKNNAENLNHFMKDLKELIGKEVTKGLENRKSGKQSLTLNNKELKELALNIIERIKKNKSKETVKHEVKIAMAEEFKNDKKLSVISAEEQLSKKLLPSDDTSSDKNGGKDKHSGRDNFSYNTGKMDFSSKSGIDRLEQNRTMMDFKENLQEIIDKAKVSVRDSRNGTFTVKLNPKELGNVNVNLIMENGVITGKFMVDNEDVKSMLLNSLNELKMQMEKAGIAVGDFSVNVNDQREQHLHQKDDEEKRSFSFFNSDKEVIAAAEQYNSNSSVNTGHINMVI